MDYTATTLLFRLRKARCYAGLYGIRRTLVKVCGQGPHGPDLRDAAPNNVRQDSTAHVGLIGCSNFGFSVIAYYLPKNYGAVIRRCMDLDADRAASRVLTGMFVSLIPTYSGH